MGVCIVLFLIFISLILSEVHFAKKGCAEMDGIYEYKFVNHLCNDEKFYKYSDGSWDWEQKPINLSNIILLPLKENYLN